MKDWLVLGVFAVVVTAALLVVGCSGGGAPDVAAQLDSTAELASLTTVVDEGMVSAAAVPSLVLALSSTLNAGGTAKVTSITSADLLNASNAVVKVGTITAGKAYFDLAGLVAGFYSIRVNNLASDLVPTKLDTLTANTWQWVAPTLRHTVIGSLTTPKYRMTTYSLGQAKHPVADYTTGVNSVPTRYAYAMLYAKASPVKLEIRRLGKNSRLTILASGGHHNMTTWAMGSSSHGTSTSSCTGCHGTSTNKQALYTGITTSKGWCYRCHYGPGGSSQGMVDPLK